MEILSKLQPIFHDIFDDGSISVGRESSAETVEGWDSLAHINLVKGEEMFGLFPEFKPFIRAHWDAMVAAVAKLPTLNKQWVKSLVDAIPVEWQVDAAARTALAAPAVAGASAADGVAEVDGR